MTSRVLVTDGDQRAALAAVRSLGRAGHVVAVAARGVRSLAGASRHAAARYAFRDPLTDPAGAREDLVLACRGHQADFLLPFSEPTIYALHADPGRLGATRLLAAEPEPFRRITDKDLVLSLASRHGIAAPAQLRVDTPGAVPPDALPAFPVVVKPSRSVAGGPGRWVKLGVKYAATADELAARLAFYPAEAYPVLVQQRVVGPGIGIFLLLWQGETKAVFAHRRIREKPVAGGVSTCRESIAADPDLVARTRALLDEFAWDGPAMVEYKVDAATGTPYLMEINGRFWGSLQLAIDAGVDFPALYLGLAEGRAVPPVTSYRTGVRCRWELGELDHLWARLRRSPQELGLLPGAPGRWRTLADVLSWRRGDRAEVLRRDDPAPFLHEVRHWFRT